MSGPVTYVPDAYDPRHAPATMAAGQVGIVYPRATSGRGVWVVLFLIVAAVVGFVGFRVMHTGAAPAPGVPYTSTAGHFSVRFPEQPVEFTKTESDSHTTLVAHAAAVVGQAAVMSLDITGPLTPAVKKLADKLATDVNGPSVTLTGVRRFSFEGHPARQGNSIDPTTGQLMTLLEVVTSHRRMYAVLGLTGPTFDALKDSFHVVP